MKFITLCIAIMLLNITDIHASNVELSNPISIPTGEGWNKILQTSNGNTLLFHFSARKALLVKVFDKERNEIASEKFLGKIFEIGDMELSELHGIYEINNEAVIFASQPIYNNSTLVALRFNTETGKIIKEQTLITSPGFKARNSYSLVVNTKDAGYAVFCMKDLVANFNEKIMLWVFDDKHEKQLEVPVNINTQEYDNVEHISTDCDNNGAYVVTLSCNKIIHYPKDIDRFLTVCYLPVGDTAFNTILTKLPAITAPYFSMSTYNAFHHKINLFLVNAQTAVYKYGLSTRTKILYSPLMLMYDSRNIGSMNYKTIHHANANKYFQEQTGDTTQFIRPVPTRAYTNKFGLTTLISEENELNIIVDDIESTGTMVGHISVTQIDDEGQERWSVVLPKKQFVNTPISIYDLQKRGTNSKLFRRNDASIDWVYQFLSYHSVMKPNGDCYVIYNDRHTNWDKTIATGVDSMFSTGDSSRYERSNAICYKITRKREVTKDNLFGTSTNDVSYAAMIEGGNYNEQTQTYSCLLLHNIDEKNVYRIGWRKLED